jgi:hypothetical protein
MFGRQKTKWVVRNFWGLQKQLPWGQKITSEEFTSGQRFCFQMFPNGYCMDLQDALKSQTDAATNMSVSSEKTPDDVKKPILELCVATPGLISLVTRRSRLFRANFQSRNLILLCPDAKRLTRASHQAPIPRMLRRLGSLPTTAAGCSAPAAATCRCSFITAKTPSVATLCPKPSFSLVLSCRKRILADSSVQKVISNRVACAFSAQVRCSLPV